MVRLTSKLAALTVVAALLLSTAGMARVKAVTVPSLLIARPVLVLSCRQLKCSSLIGRAYLLQALEHSSSQSRPRSSLHRRP